MLKCEGEWKDNKLYTGYYYDDEGELMAKYIDGGQIKI